MAVELHRLIETVSHMEVVQVAGNEGNHNIVSWVHMIESTEASEFLHGGELAFITGIGLGKGHSLIELIDSLHKIEISGIILNIGPYIPTVPADVISYCNDNCVPLFTVPWKVSLAEIMRHFAYAITKDDQKNFETAAALTNAIFFPKQEELYIVPLSHRGFPASWHYMCAVFKVAHSRSPLALRNEELAISMDNYLHHHYNNYAVFPHDSDIILVLGNYEQDDAKKCIGDVYSFAKTIMSPAEQLYIGAGRLTKSIRCLYKSFNQALSICKLQERNTIPMDIYTYSQMGIYRLLMGVEDAEIIKEYYSHTLAPLIEYDKANNSDLVNVLKTYFHFDGSVKETADHLFVHRNTINYKLGKISELLDSDLSHLETRVELIIAFKLLEIM